MNRNSSPIGAVTGLSLYHYHTCPFCARTRQVLETLDLNVEQRDILRNPQFRTELVKGGGKPQVPCLKIETSNGQTQWLYESGDIITYLRQYSKEQSKVTAV